MSSKHSTLPLSELPKVRKKTGKTSSHREFNKKTCLIWDSREALNVSNVGLIRSVILLEKKTSR